jgi:hypothetical protein
LGGISEGILTSAPEEDPGVAEFSPPILVHEMNTVERGELIGDIERSSFRGPRLKRAGDAFGSAAVSVVVFL